MATVGDAAYKNFRLDAITLVRHSIVNSNAQGQSLLSIELVL